MSDTWDTKQPDDLAISVHPELASLRLGHYAWQSRAEEFDRLVEASHCKLIHTIRQPVRKVAAGTLFGVGQIEDIRLQVEINEANVVFVDHPLTPVQ
ncbi:MAG: GTPase HflX, partial [Mariprofundaceae bacterium]